MILVAFTGKMGSGKSTAAKTLEEFGFERFSFATKLKELAEDLFEMKEKDRKLLQDFGSALREIDQDVWVKYLMRKIGLCVFRCIEDKQPARIVIDDLRYLNEAHILKQNGFILVRLICLNESLRFDWLQKHGTLDGQGHPSETEQEQILVDYTIRWATLDDLRTKVLTLVGKLSLRAPQTSTFDVKKNKVELIQFVVDQCIAKLKDEKTSERDYQRYLRILNECLKTMARMKELDQITEDDLAQLMARIPKKWRF